MNITEMDCSNSSYEITSSLEGANQNAISATFGFLGSVRISTQFDLERYGNATFWLFAELVPLSIVCFLSPAFGGALRSASAQRMPVAPARCVSLKGGGAGIGKISPLRETTSAAYGVGRDSVADALAERCPVVHSS